jgi:hypothetical protein
LKLGDDFGRIGKGRWQKSRLTERDAKDVDCVPSPVQRN